MIERIFDAITNEIKEIPLDENKLQLVEEYNQLSAEKLKHYENKLATRQSALNKLIDLGLTEDEIAAL